MTCQFLPSNVGKDHFSIAPIFLYQQFCISQSSGEGWIVLVCEQEPRPVNVAASEAAPLICGKPGSFKFLRVREGVGVNPRRYCRPFSRECDGVLWISISYRL